MPEFSDSATAPTSLHCNEHRPKGPEGISFACMQPTKDDLFAMENRITRLPEDTRTHFEYRFDGFEERLIKAGDYLKEAGEGLTRAVKI